VKLKEIISVPPKKKDSVRAILLFSGGLDSALAGLVLQDAGVEIVPLTFKSPFFGYEKALELARELNWPLVVADITFEQLRIVEKPKYGYGKNMNPCIDCHAQMVRIACGLLEKYQADFVATGEVLNERPKSQNRWALEIVAEESGCKQLLLRPLSARLLPPTELELKGLVDRSKLLDISGRSRRRQFQLAEKYGLKNYPSPAGGCLLTDPVFSSRLRKLMSWRGFLKPEDIELVRFGRNFFEGDFWIVVSRNESETKALEKLPLESDVRITTADVPGPLSIVRFRDQNPAREIIENAIKIASLLTIRYSKAREKEKASVKVIAFGSERVLNFKYEEWKPYLEKPYLPQF
jgi:tRNA U34 2-thiouridine synthase MnmA/TrmU